MTTFTSRIAMASALACSLSAAPAFAEDSSEEGAGQDPHDRGAILVTAEALKDLDFIAGQDVLDQGDIQRDIDGQLG